MMTLLEWRNKGPIGYNPKAKNKDLANKDSSGLGLFRVDKIGTHPGTFKNFKIFGIDE